MKEFLLKWYNEYVKLNLAPSTQKYYDIIINSHLIPVLGNIKLSQVKPIFIQNYITKKLTAGRLDGKEGGGKILILRMRSYIYNKVLVNYLGVD